MRMATDQQLDATAPADNAAPDDTELFLVDGSGYIFRAFFALPQNLTNKDGVPVGAVMGFTNMMVKLLKDMKAPYIAVIFDHPTQNFRYQLYDDYKANRSELPPELAPQFPMIRDATRAFGIPAIELEGYEADDLIATYARLATEQGRKVTIVGSDKDLMQLVGGNVRMYDPIKGKYLGPDDVQEKFGVLPDRVIDVQALAGDSVDNIPGVPGIGVKTAAQLIMEYGSLEALLERAHEIKQPKRRDLLLEHADNARLSKKLVTLATDAPVPMDLAELKAHDPNTPDLTDFLRRHGFKTLLNRLEQTAAAVDSVHMPHKMTAKEGDAQTRMSLDGFKADLPPASANAYTLIDDLETLKAWLADCVAEGVMAVDTETTDLTPSRARLVGVSLSSGIGRAAYIPLGHVAGGDLLGIHGDVPKQLAMADAMALLKPVLEDPGVLKIGHNIKYDMQIFAAYGIDVHPVDDTMLMSYVLNGTSHGHGMDELVQLYCDHCTIKYDDVTGTGKNRVTFDRVPVDKALLYAAEDAECTLRLHRNFKPRLGREYMTTVYEDIERPVIPVLARMERTGIKVDTSVLQKMSGEFGERMLALEAAVHRLAGHPFNIGSPKQLGQVLFDEMGIPGGRKTKTGDWSTSADILEDLGTQGFDVVDRVLEYRQVSKLKSTYTDALQQQINPATGRVHTSFQMAGTSTGRLSSSDPNLQNIPIRTEDGRKIRTAFVAEDGWTLLSVDYSQVELRLAAEMAGIEALRQAFRDKVDIHTLTASQVFDTPIDQMTPELRRAAKAVNFGIIYGISGWGLAKQLGIGQGDANTYIRKYLSRFPEIQNYMEEKKAEARRHGYVKTLYGRKCFIANINNKIPGIRAGAERQAINAPLQGTAADIMKIAMGRMPFALDEAGLQARMLLQVHDELLFEVPVAEIDETTDLVKAVMEQVAELGVPLEAEAGHGHSWAAAH